MSKISHVPQAYEKQEEGYRIKALRLYPGYVGVVSVNLSTQIYVS